MPSTRLDYRRIARLVVAYDGSDSANAAAAFALWLAGKTGCEATIIHASPTPATVASADLVPVASDQVVAYELEWQRRLETLREYAATDAAVHGRVVHGNAAGVLIAEAVEARADLILTGSHGVGRGRGALLGSVSSQILTHAPCSVMVFREAVPPVPAAHARHVVVGIDGSQTSADALELAQALAVPLGAALVLVHAYNPHIRFAALTTGGIHELLRRHGHELLDAARERLTAPLDVVEVVVDARPREALITACGQYAPALLAVGSRGLGGFKGLLLGSTSRWVVNHAPCPVLVARHGGEAATRG
jgi:nucleotide-binding universal stress UspA family protein